VVLPHRGVLAQQVLLLGEELVAGGERRAADGLAREIGQIEEVGHGSSCGLLVRDAPT